MSQEMQLRAAVLRWLKTDQFLAESLNTVAEEAPLRASIPWLGLAASASIDWSTKEKRGRETRIALELHLRGDVADTGSDLVGQVERRIEEMPTNHGAFDIVSIRFLRSRSEQRSGNIRAALLEYRFRTLEV